MQLHASSSACLAPCSQPPRRDRHRNTTNPRIHTSVRLTARVEFPQTNPFPAPGPLAHRWSDLEHDSFVFRGVLAGCDVNVDVATRGIETVRRFGARVRDVDHLALNSR